MDLIHRLMILVAVLCCHCHCNSQRVPIIRWHSDILQPPQGLLLKYLEAQSTSSSPPQPSVGAYPGDESTATSSSAELPAPIKFIAALFFIRDTVIHQFGDRWYAFSIYKRDWNGAEVFCQQNGGHLVQITTDEQFEFVKDKSTDYQHWIGLSDTDSEGTYKWIKDGSSHDPSSKPYWWAAGEPNNQDNEDCIEYSPEWLQLNDEDCSKKNWFVCEFGGSRFYLGDLHRGSPFNSRYITS